MRKANLYLTGSAAAAVAAILIYLFSYPLALWALLETNNTKYINSVGKFYAPALWLAYFIPPYRAILVYEHRQLGFDASEMYPRAKRSK